MHMRFFFIALLINKATTLLSTPPDKAQMTLSFLITFLGTRGFSLEYQQSRGRMIRSLSVEAVEFTMPNYD